MTNTIGNPVLERSTVAASDWEPFLIDGKETGQVHWIRTAAYSEDRTLFVGLWRSEPQSFPYVFGGDETFHVLAGSVTITTSEGTTHAFTEGDIASFVKGTESTWTIDAPFKKLFVIGS